MNEGVPAEALRRDTRGHVRRQWTWVAASVLPLAVLLVLHVQQGAAGIGTRTVLDALLRPDGSLHHEIVRHLRLPRATAGLLAGAALGVAGVLMQSVTRNPLASPGTLGVNAGAFLAVVVVAVYAPGSSWAGGAAFAGGLAAAAAVFAVAGGWRAAPVRLALAGVAITLALAALTAALQLLHENETAGLFFWGSGSLMQNGWAGVVHAAPRLALAGGLALLLCRALDVMGLGDDVAQGLGQRVDRTRAMAVLLAVYLAAVTVQLTGPIGFVGLVAPHLVRLMGVRRHLPLLLGSAAWGAVVVLGADVAARWAHGGLSEVPTGVVTALIGTPFLVWLVRRDGHVGQGARPAERSRRPVPFAIVAVSATVLLVLAVLLGLARGAVALDLATIVSALTTGEPRSAHYILFELRLPRVLTAAAAGAALAVGGALVQAIARNPLAAPETVGVTAGAGLGALVALLAVPGLSVAAVPLAAFLGGLLAFAAVYLAAWKGGLDPVRLALVGIGVAAFCAAWTNLLVVQQDVRLAQALVWLSGSTYARGWDDLGRLLLWPVVLIPVGWSLGRGLDLLGLGDDIARGLGVRVERERLLGLLVAVALTAAAVSVVGAVGFVGLVAPHMARLLLGARHRRLVPAAALLGALLVVVADLAGRLVLAPKEIPSGLVTALIGAPYFLWLLWWGSRPSRVA